MPCKYKSMMSHYLKYISLEARPLLKRRGLKQGTPLLFSCAKTVSEPHLLEPFGMPLSEKQIPQIAVNIWNRRKTMEPLEPTRAPWAQGVGRSNRPAPAKSSLDSKQDCLKSSGRESSAKPSCDCT